MAAQPQEVIDMEQKKNHSITMHQVLTMFERLKHHPRACMYLKTMLDYGTVNERVEFARSLTVKLARQYNSVYGVIASYPQGIRLPRLYKEMKHLSVREIHSNLATLIGLGVISYDGKRLQAVKE